MKTKKVVFKAVVSLFVLCGFPVQAVLVEHVVLNIFKKRSSVNY